MELGIPNASRENSVASFLTVRTPDNVAYVLQILLVVSSVPAYTKQQRHARLKFWLDQNARSCLCGSVVLLLFDGTLGKRHSYVDIAPGATCWFLCFYRLVGINFSCLNKGVYKEIPSHIVKVSLDIGVAHLWQLVEYIYIPLARQARYVCIYIVPILETRNTYIRPYR